MGEIKPRDAELREMAPHMQIITVDTEETS